MKNYVTINNMLFTMKENWHKILFAVMTITENIWENKLECII